jgi:gliding motility-associated-like protein
MKYSFLKSSATCVLLMAWGLEARAQVPTKCFEIESILVDACISSTDCPGSQEGQNEMVRFRIGPDPIALADISADWPNNSWRGLEQNGTTAALTATLNATIESCGLLLEPPGGVIPAGSQVLMVTSTDMCTQANPFTALGDTLYLVFQAQGNTAGHFGNHTNGGTVSPTPSSAPSFRTLVMTYLPTNCGDTVTYDRSLLTNVLGSYGGNSAQNDGATAVFTWPGPPQASYINLGCQAPFVPVNVSIEVTGDLCDGGTVQLLGVPSGATDSVLWSGGSGVFSNPTANATTYTPGPSDLDPVALTFCAFGGCADPVCATVDLPTGNAPIVSIVADGPLALCPGEDVLLTATGADSYVWNSGATTATFNAMAPGTYTVTGTNACGQADASVTVSAAAGPSVFISGDTAPCAGTSTVLTASGADSYIWSNGVSGASITVSAPGTVSVTGTNACGTGSASVTVEFGTLPDLAISGSPFLCPQAVLTASGATSYVWNTGATTATITATASGTYTVTGTNACGTSTASVDVQASPVSANIQASIVAGPPPLEVVFNNTSQPSTAQFSWDLGDGTTTTEFSPTHVYEQPGVYVVVLVATDGECGSTGTVVITVYEATTEPSSVLVPNVFSPNGDGLNDRFQVTTTGILGLDMTILNRWGQVVNVLERADEVWDGRSAAGEVLSEGTYFYVLKASGSDGGRYDLSGTITLLR